MQERISPYLFHYTKASCAIAILREGKLRFSTLSKCNDPYETKVWRFGIRFAVPHDWDSEEAKRIPHGADISPIATRTIRNRWQVVCFTGSEPNDTQPFQQGGCIAPMWAHYGGNHTGACLILRWDEAHEAFVTLQGVEMGIWGSVDYSSDGGLRDGDAFTLSQTEMEAKGLERALNAHALKFSKQLFLTKHKSWSYEQEHRFLARSDAPLEIPILQAIRGVYVGSDCAPQDLKLLIQLGEALNVEVRRMTWVNGNPLGGDGMLFQPPGLSRLFFYR